MNTQNNDIKRKGLVDSRDFFYLLKCALIRLRYEHQQDVVQQMLGSHSISILSGLCSTLLPTHLILRY